MKKGPSQSAVSPSAAIDARIEELGDWRGEMLSRLRVLIKQADPEVTEEWKWNTPVLKARSGAPSTSMKAKSWTRRLCRLSFGPPWP